VDCALYLGVGRSHNPSRTRAFERERDMGPPNLAQTGSILALLVASSLYFTAEALTFKLAPTYYAKCFSENIPPDTPVYVDYIVAGEKGLMDVNFWVKNPQNKVMLNKQMIDRGAHSFMTGPGGVETYRFCFLHELYKKTFDENAYRMVTMNLKLGHNAKHMINPPRAPAKTEDLDAAEKLVSSLEETLEEALDQLEETRNREQEMEEEAQRLARRITLFSATACLVIIAMGVYDFYYTKQFLKKKKII